MWNIISAIFTIVLVVCAVLTFISEPQLSISYYKALIKSGFKFFAWGAEKIQGIIKGASHQKDKDNPA